MSMVVTDSTQHASTLTVLVIDDNEADLQYWSDTVRNLSPNYRVLKAQACELGLEICRNRTVDCVLLDVDMPESGFFALFELIPDRKRPPIAVIILTRLLYPNLAEMARHNGAQAWLVKQRPRLRNWNLQFSRR